MGIFNADKKSTCQQNERGPPGLSIKGDPGKDAVLPQGILLDTGFVMQADIDMNNKRIFNLTAYPRSDDDAISKRFVDNYKFRSDEFLRVDGSNMLIQKLNANNQIIGTIADAINQYDSVHKHYVDELDSKNMKLNEMRKMQNSINMNGHNIYNVRDVILGSSSDTHATNKKYVDLAIKNKNDLLEAYILSKEHNILLKLGFFLKLDGSRFMGSDLNMNNNRIMSISPAISQTDAINLNQMNQVVSAFTSHFLNTQTGGNLFGDLDMKMNRVLNIASPIDHNDCATKNYVDLKIIPTIDEKLFIKRDGSQTMTGNFDLNNNRIMGLNSHPVNLREATCKEYVDRQHTIINFAMKSQSDAPPPFNYNSSSIYGLYGYSSGNNPIQYGISMIPFICANYFEYFPSGIEQIPRIGQGVNFVDLRRNNNNHTIYSGYGIALTRAKNRII